MKNVQNMGAQGDVMFIRIQEIPETAKKVEVVKGSLVISHSETGHHHTVDGTGIEMYAHPDNPLICFLRLETGAEVTHHRPWDTHDPLHLPAGAFEVRRQREYVPGGFRRVED